MTKLLEYIKDHENEWVEYEYGNDGMLSLKGIYKYDRLRNGLYIRWFQDKDSGNKQYIMKYWKNSKEHGVERVYWKGFLLHEKYFYNDVKFGVWRTYDNKNRITRIQKYIVVNQSNSYNGFENIEIEPVSIKVYDSVWRSVELIYDHPPINSVTRNSLSYYDEEISGIEGYWLGVRGGFNFQKYYEEIIQPFEEKFKELN